MNPFSYGTVVKESNFYDRKKECTKIVATLSGGNNMVLYAPRRFGKTSLVFKAMEVLEAMGFLCIYFDFMPVFSAESFVRLYAKALAAKQSNLSKFTQMFASIIKNIRPTLSFGQDGKPEFSIDFAGSQIDETLIAQLLDMPEHLTGKNKRAVVFFDEFQEVNKLKDIHFEALLRSKIQLQRRTNYLFLGSKTHLLAEMFNNKNRAFYHSAAQMTIESLPQQDTIAFLQSRFAASNISIDNDTANYLITAAANIPHYIQFLASEIWQEAINNLSVITKGMVDYSVQNVLTFKSDYYMELFDRQPQSAKQLLKALTIEGKNLFSAAYISKHRLPVAATLQRAVKKLINDGIIEKNKDEYFITDPFFRLFLGQY